MNDNIIVLYLLATILGFFYGFVGTLIYFKYKYKYQTINYIHLHKKIKLFVRVVLWPISPAFLAYYSLFKKIIRDILDKDNE